MNQPTKPESPNLKNPRSDAEILLRYGSAVGVPRSPTTSDLEAFIEPENGIPYLVAPDGYIVHSLEHLLPVPARKRACVSVTTTDSFIAYTKKHGSLDECVIYANIDAEASGCTLIAIINDNGADDAKWRDHRCNFEPALSVEWKRWTGKNKAVMSQADFATWLEDNQGDVRSVNGSPTGADILAMAQAFEVNADKRVKSHINLQSGGVRFEFIEDETKDTRTSMEVFRRFTLALPVFEGSNDAYPIEARLKYRDSGGKVSFWYELIRPDRAFKTAVQSSLDQIKEATGFMILQGTA
jgi:uncharacterized protein YfdQ (DUF2303 family)